MKMLKVSIKVMFFAFVFCLIAFILGNQFYPEQTSEVVGLRFYTVLTDSMEPTIPTYSLVLSKVIPVDEDIKPNTIVTFKADRFGEDILLTHYFRRTQEKDGVVYYRTQPEGKDINDELTYDAYETKRSDIVGTYVFHIPYVGKIILFLQSKFGLLMYAELAVVWLVNKLIKARWEEKEDKKQKEKEAVQENRVVIESVEQDIVENTNSLQSRFTYLSGISITQKEERCQARALLHNVGDSSISNVNVMITLFDEHCVVIKEVMIEVASKIEVQPHCVHQFIFECSVEGSVKECTMYIKR